MDTDVSRNAAEVERSASEASKIILKPLRSEIDRYLAPPGYSVFSGVCLLLIRRCARQDRGRSWLRIR